VRYEQDGIHLTITSTPANLRRIQLKMPAPAKAPDAAAPESRGADEQREQAAFEALGSAETA
jgi:hypothetical protein